MITVVDLWLNILGNAATILPAVAWVWLQSRRAQHSRADPAEASTMHSNSRQARLAARVRASAAFSRRCWISLSVAVVSGGVFWTAVSVPAPRPWWLTVAGSVALFLQIACTAFPAALVAVAVSAADAAQDELDRVTQAAQIRLAEENARLKARVQDLEGRPKAEGD